MPPISLAQRAHDPLRACSSPAALSFRADSRDRGAASPLRPPDLHTDERSLIHRRTAPRRDPFPVRPARTREAFDVAIAPIAQSGRPEQPGRPRARAPGRARNVQATFPGLERRRRVVRANA
jgi:hypothetical protein